MSHYVPSAGSVPAPPLSQSLQGIAGSLGSLARSTVSLVDSGLSLAASGASLAANTMTIGANIAHATAAVTDAVVGSGVLPPRTFISLPPAGGDPDDSDGPPPLLPIMDRPRSPPQPRRPLALMDWDPLPSDPEPAAPPQPQEEHRTRRSSHRGTSSTADPNMVGRASVPSRGDTSHRGLGSFFY